MVIHLFGASVEHIKSESLRGVFYIDDAFRLVTYNIHSGDKRPIAHIATMKNFETVACVNRRRKLFFFLSLYLITASWQMNIFSWYPQAHVRAPCRYHKSQRTKSSREILPKTKVLSTQKWRMDDIKILLDRKTRGYNARMTLQKAWYWNLAMMETVFLKMNLRAEKRTALTYQMRFYFK